MAVRYPLIVDTTDNNKIKELPSGDSLNLSGNNIVNVVDITASGTLTVQNLAVESTTFTVDGNSLNAVAFTGSYTDLSNTPTLFDGVYSSLTGKPSIPANIEDLANVGSTSPANGEILIYDSTLGRYEPGTIDASFDAQFQDQNIDNLNNVVFTGDKTNDVLKFVDGIWKNERVDFDELTGTLNVVQQGDTLTGSLIGDVKGSIFADDSTLLVDSVNNIIRGIHIGDVTGSVFADDSSILVDGVNNVLRGTHIGNVTGNVTGDLTGNLTGDTDIDGSLTFYSDDGNTLVGSIRNSFDRLEFYNEDGTRMFYFENTQKYVQFNKAIVVSNSQYVSTNSIKQSSGASGNINIESGASGSILLGTGTTDHELTITDGVVSVLGRLNATVKGDVTGSVFADDSSLLVDAVSGEIPGYVKIADLKTALQDGAGDYAAFKAWVLANL